MEQIVIVEKDGRYAYRDIPEGMVEETRSILHSPYGCSKGTGDQYVRDYARIYGLDRRFSPELHLWHPSVWIEDQGWVAWFTIATILGKPITLYGDGKQVRDVLWVDDLIDLYQAAIAKIDVAAGQGLQCGWWACQYDVSA